MEPAKEIEKALYSLECALQTIRDAISPYPEIARDAAKQGRGLHRSECATIMLWMRMTTVRPC